MTVATIAAIVLVRSVMMAPICLAWGHLGVVGDRAGCACSLPRVSALGGVAGFQNRQKQAHESHEQQDVTSLAHVKNSDTLT